MERDLNLHTSDPYDDLAMESLYAIREDKVLWIVIIIGKGVNALNGVDGSGRDNNA